MHVSIDIDVDEVSLESLEYVEELLFYELDEAYRQYYQEDLPMRPEIRAYKEAMETVTAIRRGVEESRSEAIKMTGRAVAEELSL